MTRDEFFFQFERQQDFKSFCVENNLRSVLVLYKLCKNSKEIARSFKRDFTLSDIKNAKKASKARKSIMNKKMKRTSVFPSIFKFQTN